MYKARFTSTFIMIFIFCILTSCSNSSHQNFSQATIILKSSLSVELAGGIMVYGRGENNNNFAVKIDSETPSPSIELPKGMYDFIIVGWSGPNPLEGTMRCSLFQSYPVLDDEVTVSLSISTNDCANDIFGEKESKLSFFQTAPLSFTSCVNLEAVEEFDSDPYNCERGRARSYQVVLPSADLSDNQDLDAIRNDSGLVSNCYSEVTADFSSVTVDTNIIIPHFQRDMTDAFIPSRVIAYDNSDCTGDTELYIYDKGDSALANGKYSDANYDNARTHIFLHSNFCEGSRLSATPFATGSVKEYADGFNIICTKEQLLNVADNDFGISPRFFVLGDDIDLENGSAVIDSGEFQGVFIGNDKTIRNGTISSNNTGSSIGMFSSISQNAEITDLVLDNINVEVTDESNVGILVGSSDGNFDIQGVEVSNSSLIATNTDSINANTNIGILIGNASSTINSLIPSYLQNNMIISSNIELNGFFQNVGGLVGQVSGVDSSNFTYIEENEVDSLIIKTDSDSTSSENLSAGVGRLLSFSSFRKNIFSNIDMNLYNDINIGGAVGAIDSSVAAGEVYFEQNTLNGSISNQCSSSILFNIGGAIGLISDSNSFSSGLMIIALNSSDIVLETPDCSGVGGFIGKIEPIDDSIDMRLISTFSEISCLHSCGGFGGDLQHSTSTISNSGSITTINGSGNSVGGFIGSGSISVENSYTDSDVISSGNNIGGFFGSLFGGSHSNLITSGSVSGNTSTGTFVGFFDDGLVSTIDNIIVFSNRVSGTGANEVFGVDNNAPDLIDAGLSCFIPGGSTGCSDSSIIEDSLFSDTSLLGQNFVPADWNATVGESEIKHEWRASLDILMGENEIVTGWENNPIVLTSPEQWNEIGDNQFLSGLYYKLGSDIDFLNSIELRPIGSSSFPFIGQFNGNNFSIKNVSDISSPKQGIFNELGPGAIIGSSDFNSTSLTLDNINFSDSVQSFSGVLAGIVSDSVTQSVMVNNVKVINSSVEGDFSVGGVIGSINIDNSDSVIRWIQSDTVVLGTISLGGVFGEVSLNIPSASTLSSILSSSSVSGASDNVGGIIGNLTCISDCELSKVVVEDSIISSPTGSGVGGVVGNIYILDSFTLSEVSVSEIDLVGASDSGGMIGKFTSVNDLDLDITGALLHSSSLTGADGLLNATVGTFSSAGNLNINNSWTSNITLPSGGSDFYSSDLPVGVSSSGNFSNSGDNSDPLSDSCFISYSCLSDHFFELNFDLYYLMSEGEYPYIRKEDLILFPPTEL